MNTRHILFIVSGAFSGLEKIIEGRLRKGQIGFGAKATDWPEEEEIYHETSTQDFIDFGFEAEFIGRLPVRVVCEKLGAPELLEIMERSEGSLLRQYEREFAAYGISAKFERDALEVIAERAAKEGTGARGLLTVCEQLLRGFKFDLPGTSVSHLVIDRTLVEDTESSLEKYRELGREVNVEKVAEEVSMFVEEFSARENVRLKFEEDAIAALGSMACDRNMSALQLCHQLFKDYKFGLRLIQKNTGKSEFSITAAGIENPDGFLSDMVVKSYDRGTEAAE